MHAICCDNIGMYEENTEARVLKWTAEGVVKEKHSIA